MEEKLAAATKGRIRWALVVNASGRRIGLEACFFFFEKADYFVGESEQFSGVLLNGSLTTEFYPAFFSAAIHLIGPPQRKRGNRNMKSRWLASS